jgi:hypothetical protein
MAVACTGQPGTGRTRPGKWMRRSGRKQAFPTPVFPMYWTGKRCYGFILAGGVAEMLTIRDGGWMALMPGFSSPTLWTTQHRCDVREIRGDQSAAAAKQGLAR